MAFRKKYHKVLSYHPDLLVIQECEHREKLEVALKDSNYNEIIWYGSNPHKGVGVISFNNCHIEITDDFNTDFEYIIPVKLTVEGHCINLFAVWAMPSKTDRQMRYVRQVWAAINYYANQLDLPSILIGDFNSNAIWNDKYKTGHHSDVVHFLNDRNIYSLYHNRNDIQHGEELDPTIYLLKQKTKPYHLDYCFVSDALIGDNTTITVGAHNDWIEWSDHMPLIIDGLKKA